MASFEAAFRGVRLDVAAVVGRDLLADGRLTFVDGDRTAALNALDEGGSAVVPASLARSLGLRVGDEAELPVGGGAVVRLRIVGIVERSIPGRTGEAMLVGWSDATDGFGVSGADSFAVRFAPDRHARRPGGTRRPGRRLRPPGQPGRPDRGCRRRDPRPASSGCSTRSP